MKRRVFEVMGYIRGWRQLTAIFYFIECLLKGNLRCCQRELEIMIGFAKPYAIIVSPTFVESYRKLFGDEETVKFLYKLEEQQSREKEKEGSI